MPLTPQEVASKVFGPTRMRRGYDENEVDAFLDQVEAELTRLTTDNERLRQELEQARKGIAPSPAAEAAPVVAPDLVKVPEAAPAAPVAEPEPATVAAAVEPATAVTPPDDTAMEQRVTRMLVLAQQTADAAVLEAQTDADRTRGAARVEAERVLSEARSRAAEEIGSLERNKAGLETEIEGLETFEREYRQRLRAYLEMQLHDLETGKSGPPAVEGRHPGELGGASSGEGSQNGGESAVSGTGLADPPGFGTVWSPDNSGSHEGDPLVAAPADQEAPGGGSPFDTGSEGHHDGG
ncbi:MAG TPA: DivIVA domain-containing protein [Frankiaceae bacterium]|jgi:DivIVA domain-containing protein|nr:DivIVA domain-containing protein [Frankiaceae bacterium]